MSNSSARRLFSYETGVLFLLCLTFGIVFFDRNAALYLSPFIAPDLKLNNTQIGLLGSALSLTWALSAYFFGAWSDRLGARKPFLVASVLSFSVCSFLSGIAQSFGVLFASRLLMGLAEGPFLPVAMTILMAVSSEERRGLNMGVMQNFFSSLMGSFLAPLVLVAIAEHYNWRYSFFIAGIPGLICAFFIWKYVREPARIPAPRASVAAAPDRLSFFEFLRVRNVRLCILISSFMVPWMLLAWNFLPVFYPNYRHFTNSEMSYLMSVLGVSAAVGAFVVSGLSDRFGRKPIMIIFSLIGAVVPLAALYYTGPFWGLVVLVFIGWQASGVFPLYMGTIPAESTSPRHIASAMGLVVCIGEVVASAVTPLAGYIADRTTLAAPMLIELGCALMGAFFALFLVETAPVKVAGRRATVMGARQADA
ncbi:MAG TPA: MFS transporter [Steroidobacteraceae bacterium]|nr:MFS transporter [Steroidobacteraceae bacterium]